MNNNFQFIPVNKDSKVVIIKKENYEFLLEKWNDGNGYSMPCGCRHCISRLHFLLEKSGHKTKSPLVAHGKTSCDDVYDRGDLSIAKLLDWSKKFLEEFEPETVNNQKELEEIVRFLKTNLKGGKWSLLNLIDDASLDEAARHLFPDLPSNFEIRRRV